MNCPSCGHPNLPGTDTCEECQSNLTAHELQAAQTHIEHCLMVEKVESLRPRAPLTVRENEPLAAAAETLRQHDVGCLLVVDESGRLTGILTEGRLLRRVGADLDRLNRLKVSDVMRANPETVNPDHPLAHAIHRMIVSEIRYLPLVDSQRRPVGIVSSGDIAEFIETHCPDGESESVG